MARIELKVQFDTNDASVVPQITEAIEQAIVKRQVITGATSTVVHVRAYCGGERLHQSCRTRRW